MGDATSNKVLTIPNVLSFARIALIPVFVVLLLQEETRVLGFSILAAVASTDWVDGFVARRTGQVTELGKLLDPVADRLAIAAALVTFVAIGAVPLWAAILVLGRDAAVLLAGIWLGARGVRIDVRPLGKHATFTLWFGVGMIAWGNLGFVLPDAVRAIGWIWFLVGTAEYYLAAAAYAVDARRSLARRRG